MIEIWVYINNYRTQDWQYIVLKQRILKTDDIEIELSDELNV